MHRFHRLMFSAFVIAFVALIPWPADAKPGDQYTISLITMSPGDPIFFRFGHNAILVRDSRRKTHRVYNWGTFSFQEEGLISKFLQGRLTYWLSIQPLGPTLAHYDLENRWIAEQELNLTAEQKPRLVDMITDNARPENRTYRYHYYTDNCSTRVRDVIDAAIDGKLRAISKGKAELTYRGQTSRLVADIWWGYVFLNLAMGNFIDQPITEWEEMFVPSKVRQMVRKVNNVDESGKTMPLVRAEKVLVKAPDRKPPPDRPPNRTLQLLWIGLAVGAFFGWTGFRLLKAWPPSSKTGNEKAKKQKAPLGRRLALALPLAVWTLLTGFLGFLFLFFWTMTDHEVAYHNENLLQVSPLTAAFPVIAMGLLAHRQWAPNALKWVAYACAAMSVLGLLCKMLPFVDQINGSMIAFLMPMWLGLAAGPFFAEREANKRKVDPTPKSNPAQSQDRPKSEDPI